ncbi:N-acetylglucosamine/diacetylchitobiose ABC transporter substrate-binding protein [Xylanimonas ulmi]|uniref:N-acetylglucosamine transport system substrate-binding protein n=1 Tax=Xylanimonas ulmi TaxID=228973 RepID=A0A4Q7M5K0_9MICO|nr:N-acetylglucosamine/diacetylchitobiose ABC transporter substrate-binding protein [Xylanibacterium ulmi]RZS61922.1 N-acetylglucosamine transport system substrate-binding protein [Xylanibacterium ulmi]
MPPRIVASPRAAVGTLWLSLTVSAVVAAVVAAAGCTGPAGDPAASPDAVGPLGAPARASVEVYLFDGAYGSAYLDTAVDLYHRALPGSPVEVKPVHDVATQLQPRFVAGDPPDLVDNSGRPLDLATLADAGQLTDLAPLLAAPSFDDPDVTVGQTLADGVASAGSVDGRVLALRYVTTAYGLWYSQALFDRHGWEAPTTWDGLLALGDRARARGVALLVYPGQAMGYVADVFVALVGKQAGVDALRALDNLEPNAWRNPAVVAAFAALAELGDRGLVLAGSEALTHTEAQTELLRGQALFYPAGSWLTSETRATLPAGFDLAIAPVPALDPSTAALDAATVAVAPSEEFVVPTRAKNPAGAQELLRAMLSREAAAQFSRLTGAPTVVRGALDGVEVSPVLRRVLDAIDAGGEPELRAWFRVWYEGLRAQWLTTLGDVLAGRTGAREAAATMQAAADDVASDASVTKHMRPDAHEGPTAS